MKVVIRDEPTGCFLRTEMGYVAYWVNWASDADSFGSIGDANKVIAYELGSGNYKAIEV